MKITDVRIDGFGVWRELQLNDLSPRLTAFYGANEAGKTTLMQFVRSVLYGFSDQRRERYLPPLAGGQAGGSLKIVDAQDAFEVSRLSELGEAGPGRVLTTTAAGETGGDRRLHEALADVDETTFNNIFAVGLREIQELGTLSDTQAAQSLYRLTSGIDRVSLYDVIQGLRRSRNDLLATAGQKSKITTLVDQRDALRAQLQQHSTQNRKWSQLAVRIGELDEEIVAAEAQLQRQEQHARIVEIAVELQPKWEKRARLARQLERQTGQIELPSDAVEQLDDLESKIENHRRQAAKLQGQRQQLREESQRLGINQLLVDNVSRVTALGEQRDWLESLGRQVEELDSQADELEHRLTSEQDRLARVLGLKETNHLQEINSGDLQKLQPLVEQARAAEKQHAQAQRGCDALAEGERSLTAQIDSAMVGGERHGLPMDLEEASDLVAQLRRRAQVEHRLEKARDHEAEMEQQGRELLEEQVIPLWLFGWLLAAFVVGALLVGSWLLVPGSPFGTLGGVVAAVGLCGGAFAFLFKYFTESAASNRLDDCHRHMEVLGEQLQAAQRDRKKLDAELPLTDGAVQIRLQAAEQHLEDLEAVLPVEAQRREAEHKVTSAKSRVAQSSRVLEEALAAWQAQLSALGFSEKLEPQRFLSLLERYEALLELEKRARYRREDASQRRREQARLVRRVANLCEETNCLPEVAEQEDDDQESVLGPLDLLDHLLGEFRRQHSAVEQREHLRKQARELKDTESKHRRAVAGLERRRQSKFDAAHCEDEQAYRQLVLQQANRLKMRRRHAALCREVTDAISRHAPEETFAELLDPEAVGRLDPLWESACEDLQQQQDLLKKLAERRGAMEQQQRSLAEDRSLAERQLELSCVEQRLADAWQSWRVKATVSRVLERIRADYEAHRQPETLEEASRYMAQLTGDRYRRVWTPLANDILLVDNDAGESLPVEVLSRGTREQLYLSVRLAVVAMYARRGITLPMVLDDVLVNFDAVRAQRAAEVLCKFAAEGHQLLVFTCHEHIWQMFQSQQAECHRLPDRLRVAGPPIAEPEPLPEPEQAVEEPVAELVAEPVQEQPEPKPSETEYAWQAEPQSYEYGFHQGEAENSGTLAYIVPATEGSANRPDGHDHLEPRRA